MVLLAFSLAYWAREAAWFSPQPGYMMPFSGYLNLTLAVAIAWLAIFAFTGMYSLGSYYTPLQIWNRTFVGVSVSLAIFIIILFGLKEAF